MIISGWGIFLIFGANQGLVQTLAPYPPFGLVTNTVLIIGGFLMLLGIYNSAILVYLIIICANLYTNISQSQSC